MPKTSGKRTAHSVELIAMGSNSPRYLKGVIRQQMPSGLAGVVLVGDVPKAYAEAVDDGSRDIFLCDMYLMNQNTRDLPGGRWEDPGWLDVGGLERLPRYAGNGFFDLVTDGDGHAQVGLMAPTSSYPESKPTRAATSGTRSIFSRNSSTRTTRIGRVPCRWDRRRC